MEIVEGIAPRTFHWLMTILIISFQVGGSIDAWTHIHFGFAIESFFVPSHYVLYGAWFLIALLVSIYAARNARLGKARGGWLPHGYNATALGAILFGLGGVFDSFWHTTFGFEVNLQTPLSPAHILLFVAAGLMYLGVLRHSLYKRKISPMVYSSSIIANLPLVLGVASLLGIVIWPTWYFDPLTADYASGGAVVGHLEGFKYIDFKSSTAQVAGVAGSLLQTVILVPFVVVPLYRWRLPVGSVTLIASVHSLIRGLATDSYVYLPAFIGAGIFGDIIMAWIRHGGEERLSSVTGYRLLAFLVPLVQFVLYFGTMAVLPAGIVWPVNLWGGVIVLSGVAGLLLSFGLISGPIQTASPKE